MNKSFFVSEHNEMKSSLLAQQKKYDKKHKSHKANKYFACSPAMLCVNHDFMLKEIRKQFQIQKAQCFHFDCRKHIRQLNLHISRNSKFLRLYGNFSSFEVILSGAWCSGVRSENSKAYLSILIYKLKFHALTRWVKINVLYIINVIW